MECRHLSSLTQAPDMHTAKLLLGIGLLWVGCLASHTAFAQAPSERRTADQQSQAGSQREPGEMRLPPATPVTPHQGQDTKTSADSPKVIPITLDAIFRLAESKNSKIGLARARVAEAAAQNDLAAKNWLPNLYMGTYYYRHEGGIANENGTITRSSFSTLFPGLELYSKMDLRQLTFERIVAERAFWQERGDLSRVTSETLVDASATYVDMLAARTSELIALEIDNELQSLLNRSEKLAQTEPAARIIAGRVRTFLAGLKQSTVRAREECARAAAKLSYLLSLDPCAMLVPLDQQLIPLELVDANVPCCDLVARVLANGPGVYETQQILALAHEAIEKANGPGRFLPVLETRMDEGGFGTGPGDSMTWDNRWDLGVQVRWNLTDLFSRSERQRILRAKAAQAHFANADLKDKLSAGVQEARDSIVFGRQEIDLGQNYVNQARDVNKLARERMMEMFALASAHDEVLLSLQALAGSEIAYLNAVRDFNKAQLRLLVLLGIPDPSHAPIDKNCPTPVQPRQ